MYSIDAVHLVAVDHSWGLTGVATKTSEATTITIIIAVIYVNFVGASTFVGGDSSMYSNDAVHLVTVDHSCGCTGVTTRTFEVTTITLIIAVIYVNSIDAVHLVAVYHSCGLTGVTTRTSEATTITIVIAVIYVNFIGTSKFVGGDS